MNYSKTPETSHRSALRALWFTLATALFFFNAGSLYSQEIQIQGRNGALPWVNIDDGDTTPRDADGTDFDNRNVVGGSNTNPFRITNRDSVDTLTIHSVTSDSLDFIVTGDPGSIGRG